MGKSVRACTRRRSSLIVPIVLLASCTPARQPVPPGEIPPPPALTASDKKAGDQVSEALMREYPPSENPGYRRRVDRITDRLLSATDSANPRFWTVTVLQGDNVANAAATRGNRIFVWTGMLNQVADDNELAAVLAHEIAHVLARHVEPDPAELTNRALARAAGIAAGQLAGDSAIGGIAGGLAEQTVQGLIVNPYSQKMELEADTVGLFLMADAGFDPRAALRFWERVSAEGGGSRLAAFFSTHPLSAERFARLKRFLPNAMRRYEAAR